MLSSQFPSRSSDRFSHQNSIYDGVSKSFRTGLLECKLQMVQLSTTRCSCIAILWVSLVSFTAIPSVLLPSECLLLLLFCVVFQRVFVVVIVYFVIDSVRKLLDSPSYIHCLLNHAPFTNPEGSSVHLTEVNFILLTESKKAWSSWHPSVITYWLHC
jgi:hypothetical protein